MKLSKRYSVFIGIIVVAGTILTGCGVQNPSIIEEAPFIKDEKPNIYIYPADEIKLEKPNIYIDANKTINVSVELDGNITCSYPEYNDGWNVTVDSTGTITDTEGKEYYCLYYEADTKRNNDMQEGFIVEKDNLTDFLEEKLTFLGLNDKERNEMIIYWLPRLQAYPYVFISFTQSQVGLKINPEPDTIIRVNMEWKGLQDKINIKEQKLEKQERKGYTVVEWGGSEL